jgi:hypothetical protein
MSKSPLLGAFAELQKEAIRHIRPFVHMEKVGSHWTDFHDFCKSAGKMQVS